MQDDDFGPVTMVSDRDIPGVLRVRVRGRGQVALQRVDRRTVAVGLHQEQPQVAALRRVAGE